MSTTYMLPTRQEFVDRRVLGGFRCVDSITGKTIVAPLAVTNSVLTIRPNRSGTWIVFNGTGLAPLTNDFLPPGSWPASTAFDVSIQDHSGMYLSRRAKIQIPAKLAPASDPASVFTPQVIPLFASSSASVGANWAVIRASVVRAGVTPVQGLAMSLIRVIRTSDNAVLATGMTDQRGEALLAVPGLGVRASSSSSGSVMEATTAVSVAAYFDATVQTQPAGWLPNPDEILANLSGASVKSATQTALLGAGLSLTLNFSISV